MKFYSNKAQLFRFILFPLVLCLSAFVLFGQDKTESKTRYSGFCENYSGGDKAVFNEVREMTVPAGGTLTVDGRRNGGISVKGENRSDVLVRACIQTRAATDDEAKAMAKNLRIETGSTIRAEGLSDESGWSVSYQILVPLVTNLKLSTYNGGIGIASVEGNIEFEAYNGGVSLKNLAGDVRGKTKNGGLSVVLEGSGWRGAGLDVETSNGGINLVMAENYAARIETGTVNGGFKSDISGLTASRENGGGRGGRISTDLNGGGAPVRVITTNGGVKIGSL